jgi:hypothetical protein
VEATNRAKGLIARAEDRLSQGANVKLSGIVAVVGLVLASGDSNSIREESDALEGFLSRAPAFAGFDFSDIFGTLRAPTKPPTRRPSPGRPNRTFRTEDNFPATPANRVLRAGMRCERADDIHGTTLITWDIWERINRARFFVAALTGQNSDVFYELGLAHALSKDVILITRSMDDVPFDLKTIRCIPYDFTPRGTRKLEKTPAETIAALMRSA